MLPRRRITVPSLLAASLLAICPATGAAAANVDLSGKVITVYAGGQVGGGIDLFTRVFMPYLGKRLPGKPTIVVKNMPGAGGMQGVAYAYTHGVNDGTTLTTMASGPIANAVYSDVKLAYNLRKFHWVGSLNVSQQMCFTWHTSSFKTIDDAMQRPMNMAATGARSNTTLLPLMLNATIGTKFKPIAGYGGASDALAVERGEMDGMCSSIDSLRTMHPDWINQHKMRFLLDVSMSNNAIPELKGVPRVMDLIKDPKKKEAMKLFLSPDEIAYPYALAPGTSEAIVAVYRAAFDEAVKDPAYLKQAAKQKQGVAPKSGDEVTAVIDSMFNTEPDIIDSVKSYVNNIGSVGKCRGVLCKSKKKNKS